VSETLERKDLFACDVWADDVKGQMDWATDAPLGVHELVGKAAPIVHDSDLVQVESEPYVIQLSGLNRWVGIDEAIKKAAPVMASTIAWSQATLPLGEKTLGRRRLSLGEKLLGTGRLAHRKVLDRVEDTDFYPLIVREVDSLQFNELADQWEDETWAYSFVERKVLHPAYQRIIGMGRDAVPLILRRLQEQGPDHWFWALEMITGENPAEGTDNMEGATDAWLAWGREIGYI